MSKITASESRSLMLQKRSGNIDLCFDLITKAALEGESQILFRDELTLGDLNELKEYGYCCYPLNETTIIRWDLND